MFMPKQPVSVTLDADNLLWLRARAASRKRRSLSDALDEILTAVRTGPHGVEASRSVVGTIDIAADDPALLRADAYLREEMEASLARPIAVHEARAPYKVPRKTGASKSPASTKRGRA
jgi:hypothetical protein